MPAPVTVTVEALQDEAARLRDALNAYTQFVNGWPYEHDTQPYEADAALAQPAEIDGSTSADVGDALATDVETQYYRVNELAGEYVKQVRAGGRPDWDRVVAATRPARHACQRVHAAGFGIDPETNDPGYILPPSLCPAHRVSMNAGSEPVVYDDRVGQYRAIADHFDLAPDVVYHPGSGHDVSLSPVFTDSHVVYADVDAAAMADLRRDGYNAHGADAADFELPGGTDVVVFRNAGLLEEAVVEATLRSGGWVVANDHLESASHLARLSDLELVAVVPHDWTGAAPQAELVDPSGLRSETDDELSSLADRSPLDLYVFRHTG
jgi:hypothetical protein